MKFKIGDRVIILPSATRIGVWEERVGNIAVISELNFMNEYILIEEEGYVWSVKRSHIKRIAIKGEQLLFAFMEEG